MKHIAQKINREAAKDPVNPENPCPKKNESPRDSALSSFCINNL